MPNWVSNGLTIEGNPEIVKALMEQMNKPFVRVHDNWDMESRSMKKKQTTYPNPVFAFWNIICPPAEIMDQYEQQPPKTKSSIDDVDAWHKEIELISATSNDWYNWNCRNWGTKWDVAVSSDEEYPETEMQDYANGENHVVYYGFNTAWSPPIPALKILSQQYPKLLFTLSYQEEQGWGGEMEILRGHIISISEYESQCRDCDALDTLVYCENDCGEICENCNWLGEADLDLVAECQTHKVYLDENHVPIYRKEALNEVLQTSNNG